MLICRLCVSFGSVSVHILCPRFNWVVSLLLSFKTFGTFWVEILYQICVLQTFLLSFWLSFQYLNHVFAEQFQFE